MIMKRNIFILFFLSIWSITYAQTAANQNDTIKLVVLAVNDQHAKIDNYGQLKAAVDQIRSKYNNVLLLSGGDNFTGNPVVDQYSDKGYPIIDLMNIVGFNASAVGNHEFDYGQETLAKRMEQAKFPFLSANIKNHDGTKNAFKPYHDFELNGIKVTVIGAIQLGNAGLPDSHPSNLKGLSFNDGVDELLNFKHLKESCNVFIALTHIGFEEDIRLAELMPELDLIMGGHTHTLTKPSHNVNGVYIMQSGSNVRNLSKAIISLVNGKVVKINTEMLNLADFKPNDRIIEEKLAYYNDNKELNQIIGTSLLPIKGSDELGSLMTDAVTSLSEVDVAFQNNGGIRIDVLAKGPITVKDIYKLDPFGNEIILFRMTPKEIKSLIFNAYKDAGDEIDLQVSGLTYTINSHKGYSLNSVELKWPNGKKIKQCKKINVGLNSYIASSYKFDHKDSGRSLFVTTAETLINYIKDKPEIEYNNVKRAFKK